MKRNETEPELTWRQEPSEEDRQAAIEFSLAGNWRVPASDRPGPPCRATAQAQNGATLVRIPYDNFLPIHLALESTPPRN